MIRLLVVGFLTVFGGVAAAQSLTLSPAAVPLGGHPGQSTTQRLRLFNGTGQALSFQLVAKDVAVRNGERVFVEAGELRGSVAATAVFSAATLSLRPGEERAVDVTVTLPAHMTCRAVVILFQGTTRIGGNATVSIGSLLTFDLTGQLSLSPGELRAQPPTASSNTSVAIPVVNDGTEPAIARGAAVLLGGAGTIVGKLALDSHRLLPGERAVLRADYPGELPSGSYRVIATIESAQRAWTRTTELTVP
jgi:hypothetical protein